MASAGREAICTHVRMESENSRDQHLEAGRPIVSPAVYRLRPAKVARAPGDWLAGFNAGLRGDAYIYLAGVQNRLNGSAGFIEGASQRLQRLAPMPITPRFALPPWWAAMMGRAPRQPVDLLAATREVRLRVERVLTNLEPITQQRDPILADPRAVWLDVTLSIVELESAIILMKRAWWP
jgi:hypothetical protein